MERARAKARWSAGAALAAFVVGCIVSSGAPAAAAEAVPAPTGQRGEAAKPPPRIQVALLLDTSGSMSGLIKQAQAHLWKIVNNFATMTRNDVRPEVEVALYQYGSSRLPVSDGYMRQVVPLTRDLDKVSEELFKLTSSGSVELCGQVILRAAKELAWSANSNDLKLIFIAGNEEFTQGSVDYREACKAAIARGITVNTIYCGNADEGARTGWADGAKIAEGSYFNIDQDRVVAYTTAPQDAEIARLGNEINKTYVPYGKAADEGAGRQTEQDATAQKAGGSSSVERAVTKASESYRNEAWDLVDAVAAGRVKLEDVPADTLPEEMQKMTPEERQKYVEEQAAKRAAIQKEIAELSKARREYVDAKQREAAAPGEATLDQAVTETVETQAEAKGFNKQ